MGCLSNALQSYYTRDGNRVVFRNGQSLTRFSLTIASELNFRQVDASVLSRIIKGERLPTTQQLRVICQLLNLTANETNHLLDCLKQDYARRLPIDNDISQLTPSLTKEIITHLSADSFAVFYQGRYDLLDERFILISQLLAEQSKVMEYTAMPRSIGYTSYLHGRTIANGALPTKVIAQMRPIYAQLIGLSQQYRDEQLYGYAQVLMSNAYYLAGSYSQSASKQHYLGASIRKAKAALQYLDDTDNEGLFALRTMVASAHTLHDQATILFAKTRVTQILKHQPAENYINMLLLTMTLSKALAGCTAVTSSDPFALQQSAAEYFRRDLRATGVYEVSSIKEEVDTLLLLKSSDIGYIREKLHTGLALADDYKFSRQKKYFTSLLHSL